MMRPKNNEDLDWMETDGPAVGFATEPGEAEPESRDGLGARTNDRIRPSLGRAPASHKSYLKSILDKAVNPESLKAIMRDIGFERTIITSGAAEISAQSCFRVQEILGIPYILCPVPFLYDEKRNIEAGFAIDTDKDHFDVYAYMHNNISKESLVISKLAHCVHRAITLDASDYDEISDEVKQVSNEASAVFFINSLVADIAMEHNSPIEFFDDKLYLQVLNRLVRITEPRWINHVAIGKKFGQIMDQFKALDPEDPCYKNNLRRSFLNLAQFMCGASDIISSHSFTRYLAKSTIQQHEGVIHSYLESRDFVEFLLDQGIGFRPRLKPLLELFTRRGMKVPRDLLMYIKGIIDEHAIEDSGLYWLSDLVILGRDPDYLPIYRQAASLASSVYGPGDTETALLEAYYEACKIGLQRRSDPKVKEYDKLFRESMIVVSQAGSELIPFDDIDPGQLQSADLGIVLDGIESLARHPGTTRAPKARQHDDAQTWFRLGRLLHRLGSSTDAIFCYKASLAIQPANSIALYNLHVIHYNAGEMPEARKYLRITFNHNRFNPHAWFGLGIFREDAGNFAGAETCYRKALSLRRDIEANPSLVETRMSTQFWKRVRDSLDDLLKKKMHR